MQANNTLNSKQSAAQCAIIAASANTTAHNVVNTNGVDMQKCWVTVDDVGTIHWYKDAKMTIRHRVGGAAIEYANGDQHWYLNGLRHRIDGPAVELANDSKMWYQNGQLHRTDGPAIEFADGDKSWWLNGLQHRVDGPAVEYTNGSKAWYLNGQQLTEQEHAHRVNPVQEMTVADIEKLLGKRIKIIK